MANNQNQQKKQRLQEWDKPWVVINGVRYDLRMGLWAAEQIEKEFGDLQETLRKLEGKGNSVGIVKKVFVILANAGRKHANQPMDVKGDVLDECSLMDLSYISGAINAALGETMKAETVDGNEADDKAADAFEAEWEEQEKNGSTGEA